MLLESIWESATFLRMNYNYRGSELLSYELVLRNRVTQNDVTLRATNSKIFLEILLSSY